MTLFSSPDTWTDDVLIPGRKIKHSFSSTAGQIHVYSMHVFDVDHAQALAIQDDTSDALHDADRDPFGNLVVVLGDMNRERQGERRHYIDPINQAN